MKSEPYQIETYLNSKHKEATPQEVGDLENVSVASYQTNKTYSLPPDQNIPNEKIICKKYM